MNNQMLIESLALGFTLLFIVISVNPMVIGDTTSIKDESPVSFLEEPLGIEFSRTYGGRDGDFGESARQTKDGGYIMVGYTRSDVSGEQALLIKTDVIGNIEWYNLYGEEGPLNIDVAYSVEQTFDGGYIFTGNTLSYGAIASDIWLVKTDRNGIELWNKIYGGNGRDHGYQVLQANDGGYVVTGYTDSYGAGSQDFCLLKTDSNGTKEWIRTYGGKESDIGWSVDKIDNGGYIITGYSSSFGVDEYNIWLVKTDENGTEMWNRTYGNFGALSSGKSVKQTSDGGFIVTGYKKIPEHGYIVPLMKIDRNGSMNWNRTFFEPQKSIENVGEEVQQTKDGGYIMVGYTEPVGSATSFMIKTDVHGSKEWEIIFEEHDFNNALYLYSVQQTMDGGFIIGGSRPTQKYFNTMHDFWMNKVGHVPDIEITKPEKALYLFNTKLIPLLFRARIIGPIDVEVEASDSKYDIKKVSFYVDDVLQADDTSEPYIWKWSKLSLFKHSLKAVAYNSNGNVGIEEIVISKFF